MAKNDTIKGLLRYEWDGNDFYAGLYFGDGAGSYNDYGQTVYLQDKIHIPEIYPAPGFKEGTVFMEIKQGVTTLWGEIDTDQLPDFYKTYAYPTKGKIGLRKTRIPVSGNLRKASCLLPLWQKIVLYSSKCVRSLTEREALYIPVLYRFRKAVNALC